MLELNHAVHRAQQHNISDVSCIDARSELTTGVDARNVRNVVLLRPVNSMIEFKQIIGRGTRLFEGKHYFTILDFVNAYHLFNDPEWDGELAVPLGVVKQVVGVHKV